MAHKRKKKDVTYYFKVESFDKEGLTDFRKSVGKWKKFDKSETGLVLDKIRED